MRVNREQLLAVLDSVSPGLSEKEYLEQSSCFVFKEGVIQTFNDEISCRMDSGLAEVSGAVSAKKLLEVLRKLKEDELDVRVERDKLAVEGQGRTARFALEAEVFLPVEHVEAPGEWRELPPDFLDAAQLVQSCAGRDETQFELTCVHVSPKWLEASDGCQLIRYVLNTGVEEAYLLRRAAAKHAAQLGACETSLTAAWAHFRCPSGLVLSARRHSGSFPRYGDLLRLSGEAVSLPKGLADEAEIAGLFSSETPDLDLVTVRLDEGSVSLRAMGLTGEYTAGPFKALYAGPAMTFSISPALLAAVVKRYSEARITEGRLVVDGGRWRYVSMLASPEARKAYEEEDDE